jgi:hypothetical protein
MLEKEGKYNDELIENIKYYTDERYHYLSPEKLDKIIKNEKKFSGYHVFYNGLNNGLGFVYEITNHFKQRIMISASKDGQRTYARFFEKMFKKHSTIQEWAEEFHYYDHNVEAQKRIACTNVFLFGNTKKVPEQTLAYAKTEISMHEDDKSLIPIKDIFMFLGDDEETSSERLKKYATLYKSSPALNERHVIQQIFVANDIVDNVTYPSGPFGMFNRLSNSKSKNITKISEILGMIRKDPLEFTKELVSNLEPTDFVKKNLLLFERKHQRYDAS